MKKIILLLVVATSLVFSAIDECKTDVYFGNGILTKEKDAIDNALLLRDTIKQTFGLDYYNRHIGKVDYAYNSTWDRSHDLLETYLQLDREDPDFFDKLKTWYMRFFTANAIDKINDEIAAAKVDEALVREIEAKDLSLQRKKYEKSIKSGHKVLIVAHSQGALYANRAFELIGQTKSAWMQKYMLPVYVAPTSSYEFWKKSHNPSFTFDNDPVSQLAHYFGFSITNNPNKYKKPLINQFEEKSFVYDKNFVFHSFEYYMGIPVLLDDYDGKRKVFTSLGKSTILSYIETQLNKLEQVPSQWKPKKEIGCVCKEKHIEVTHRFESEQMDILLKGQKIKNFAGDDEGKIYPVNGQYVRAVSGGESIKEVDKDGSCYELLDGENAKIGSIDGINESPNTIKAYDGAIDMYLSWNHECDVDMDLTMNGPNTKYDIKDIPYYPKEHAYVKSILDLSPGAHYDFEANGSKLDESSLPEDLLEEEPVSVRALLETPTGNYFKTWEVRSFEGLDIGKFAEMDVEKKIEPKWICPALNNVPGWNMLYNEDTDRFDCLKCESPYEAIWYKPNQNEAGYWRCSRPAYNSNSNDTVAERTYNECTESEKKETCGCVPCDFIVSGMQKRVENGPIAGAYVTIIRASDAYESNPEILFTTETTDDSDLFKSGFIKLSDDAKAKIDPHEYYLVSAKGGKDIDRDDDMHRDIVPTDNNGTIHAIIKGSDLLGLPFRINILTEAIFQISGDVIGTNYNKAALKIKQDDAARKLIAQKLYIKDDNSTIRYADILLWTPAVDKKALYKPFGQFVEPIIEKLYAGEDRHKESYDLIYGVFDEDAPQLKPLSLEISEGLPGGTVIAKLVTQNDKPFSQVVIEGKYSDQFYADTEGVLRIAKSDMIREGNVYHLRMYAEDGQGSKGTQVSLDISVKGRLTMSDTNASVPSLKSIEIYPVEENAPAGTPVAKITFEDKNSTIVDLNLTGSMSKNFEIDSDGNIVVSGRADLDYEAAELYSFYVSATNEHGNSSYPVQVQIPIENVIDTPQYDVEIFEHVTENTPIGTAVTTIRKDREGLGETEGFEILSPNIPFSIDRNGTISISAPLDYEQKHAYNFYTIARTEYGNSNKIEINIIIDDQEPEVGIPHLQEFLELNISEGTLPGTRIGSLKVDTADAPIQKITWFGDGYENFRIDTNGTVFVAENGRLDYEEKTRYDLGARALNARGWGNDAHIIINIKNIQDTPPVISPLYTSIVENSPSGTEVGQIIVVDPGEGNITGFVLEGDGAEDFSVDINGTISVADGIELDYETKSKYSLLVTATNAYGTSEPAGVTIRLNDLPDTPPVIEQPLSEAINENSDGGTRVGTLKIDNQGTPVTSVTLSGDGADKFSLGIDGVITVKEGVGLDFETKSIYSLQAVATNAYGTSEPAGITIRLIDLPDTPPVIEQSFFSVIDENSAGGSRVGTLKINDNGTPIISVRLSGDGADKFGADREGVITVREGASLDYEVESTYALQAVATNAYGASTPAIVIIRLNNLPDTPPVILPLAAAIDENSAGGTTVGTLDIDNQGTPVTSVTLSGDGADNFSVDIDGVITVKEGATLDYETKSTYSLQAVATNAYGTSLPAGVSIQLNNLPDIPPVIQSLSAAIDENSVGGTRVGVLGINDNGTPVTSVTLSGDGADNFSVDIDGVITVKGGVKLDYETKSIYSLQAVAANAYGTSVPRTIFIRLNNLPDAPPVIEPMVLEISKDTQVNTKIGTLNINDDGSAVSDIVLSGEGSADFSINLNGDIILMNALDNTGKEVYYLQVTAANAFGSSESASLTISVLLDSPILLGSFDTTGYAGSVVLSQDGTKAFVADGDAGLKIIDVSNPSFPALIGEYNTTGYAGSVVLSQDGTKAFVSDGDAGLKIIDVADLQSPALIGSYDTTGYVKSVVLSQDGTKAFAVDGDAGLKIIDIVDPQSPSLIGSYDTSGYVNSVALSQDGTKAFVADGDAGLKIIDIADPQSPVLIGSFDISDGAYIVYTVALSQDGTKAYVTEGYAGLKILDVSDPQSPVFISGYEVSLDANLVVLSQDGTKAFVTDACGGGLKIIDVSDPQSPAQIGVYTASGAYSIALSQDETKAFVADGTGLKILDISFLK